MGKTYIGYELVQAIAEGKIKEGSKFKIHRTVGAIAILEKGTLHFTEGNKRNLTINDLLIYTFELIEDEEIDIQSIEELDTHTFDSNTRTITIQNRNKINEILEAVKQLDKRIKQ